MVRYTADILYDSDTDDEEQLPVAEVIPEPEEEEPNPCEGGPLQSLYRCRRCEGIDGHVSYAPIQVGICADRQCYDRISLVNWAQNRRNNGQPITIPHSTRVYDGQLPDAADPNGVACGGPAPPPRRGRRQCASCTILGGKRKKRRRKKSRRKKRRRKKRRRKKTKRRRNRKRRKTKRRR